MAALRFEEIKDAVVWHDAVRLFSVWDASSSDLLGYFFLDIFSRFVFDACWWSLNSFHGLMMSFRCLIKNTESRSFTSHIKNAGQVVLIYFLYCFAYHNCQSAAKGSQLS